MTRADQHACSCTGTSPDKIAYSLATAAVAVDFSEKTLTRAIRSGQLKAKKVGRAVRIKRADLEAWIDSCPDAESA